MKLYANIIVISTALMLVCADDVILTQTLSYIHFEKLQKNFRQLTFIKTIRPNIFKQLSLQIGSFYFSIKL